MKTVGEPAFESCSSLKTTQFRVQLYQLGIMHLNHVLDLRQSLLEKAWKHFTILYFNIFLHWLNTIPSSVASIGDYAFESCSGLETVTIGKVVEAIGNYAFGSCYVFDTFTIGEHVETIGYDAFESCYVLETVTIGEHVETIEDNAF